MTSQSAPPIQLYVLATHDRTDLSTPEPNYCRTMSSPCLVEMHVWNEDVTGCVCDSTISGYNLCGFKCTLNYLLGSIVGQFILVAWLP